MNISDYIINIYINQSNNKEQLRLVTFYSKKMIFAKLNYEIHDKKLLIIITAFNK